MRWLLVLMIFAVATPVAAGPAASVVPMDGPFGSLDDYCGALAGGPRRCDDVPDPGGAIAPAAPYERIAFVYTRDRDVYAHVAIELSDGWWVQRDGVYVGSDRAKASFDFRRDARVGGRGRDRAVVARVHLTRTFDPSAFGEPGPIQVARWLEISVCGRVAGGAACLPTMRDRSVAAVLARWARRR